MRILVDVDQVVIDLLPVWLAKYNKDYDDNLTPDKITAWGIEKFVKPECGTKIYDYLNDDDLYDDAEPIPGALEAVIDLREEHTIYFVTAKYHPGKVEWLRKHGFINEGHDYQYIVCEDKYLISGDVIIDDNIDTVQTYLGLGILFSQPHNADAEVPNVVKGWEGVMSLLEERKQCPICGREAFFPERDMCMACTRAFFNLCASPQAAMHLINYILAQGAFPLAPVHRTEITRPNQSMEFLRVLAKMYQVHLDKNADYSPANILATGQVGLVTRMWDKMARLLNLTGFRIEISDSYFEAPIEPKNESVVDSFIDLAVYSIIGLLLNNKVWGK